MEYVPKNIAKKKKPRGRFPRGRRERFNEGQSRLYAIKQIFLRALNRLAENEVGYKKPGICLRDFAALSPANPGFSSS